MNTPPAKEREYTFDVRLNSVARVTATSKKEALEKLINVVDCIDLSIDVDGVRLTEASVNREDEDPDLIEIDGEAV